MENNHPWKDKMVDRYNNSNIVNGQVVDKNTPLSQDPYMYIGVGDSSADDPHFVSLAVNTNQYARTFQDRSYKFEIRKRPNSTKPTNNNEDTPYQEPIPDDVNIFNVNV